MFDFPFFKLFLQLCISFKCFIKHYSWAFIIFLHILELAMHFTVLLFQLTFLLLHFCDPVLKVLFFLVTIIKISFEGWKFTQGGVMRCSVCLGWRCLWDSLVPWCNDSVVFYFILLYLGTRITSKVSISILSLSLPLSKNCHYCHIFIFILLQQKQYEKKHAAG